MYLLDTNTLIYLQKSMFPFLTGKVKSTPLEELAVSTFTVAELVYGCHKSRQPAQNYRALLEMLVPFNILDFHQDDCDAYGIIRAALEKAGQPIGTIDTFIAAQAVSRGHVLVTHNVREFSRISEIRYEDWTQG